MQWPKNDGLIGRIGLIKLCQWAYRYFHLVEYYAAFSVLLSQGFVRGGAEEEEENRSFLANGLNTCVGH